MAKQRPPSCVGAPAFDPAARVQDPDARTQALALLHDKNDFAGAITTYFQLPANDHYVYRAVANVTLPQVQHVVSLGPANGLHAWYSDLTNTNTNTTSPPTPTPLPPPPRADIDAYTAIFQPTSSSSSALTAFAANAKKGSIRASVAAHLLAKRYIHPGAATTLHIPKKKSKKKKKPSSSSSAAAAGTNNDNNGDNPYFDFWAWSCANLEWCGPCPEAEAGRGAAQSHHVLPVLMHHFGCAVPSREALEVLRLVADGRVVVDAGSGNGYWAFVLRRHGVRVVPLDNAQSEWRVNWVGDTVIADGVKWLSSSSSSSSSSQPQNGGGGGGKDMVLLMVYPVVGGSLSGTAEGGFTRGLLAAYRGDTVAVVGTQNRNGYTSFRDMTFDEYMAREQPAWARVAQLPLPSFAGKDEALYVYQRGERAARLAKLAEEAEGGSAGTS